MVGKFSISCAFTSIFVYGSEVFPTVYRTGCIGMCEVVARFGGVFAPAVRTMVSCEEDSVCLTTHRGFSDRDSSLTSHDLLQCNVRHCGAADIGSARDEERRATRLAHTNCEAQNEDACHCIVESLANKKAHVLAACDPRTHTRLEPNIRLYLDRAAVTLPENWLQLKLKNGHRTALFKVEVSSNFPSDTLLSVRIPV